METERNLIGSKTLKYYFAPTIDLTKIPTLIGFEHDSSYAKIRLFWQFQYDSVYEKKSQVNMFFYNTKKHLDTMVSNQIKDEYEDFWKNNAHIKSTTRLENSRLFLTRETLDKFLSVHTQDIISDSENKILNNTKEFLKKSKAIDVSINSFLPVTFLEECIWKSNKCLFFQKRTITRNNSDRLLNSSLPFTTGNGRRMPSNRRVYGF